MKYRRSPAPFLVGFICFIVIGVLFAGVYWWQEQRIANGNQDTRTIVTLQESLNEKESEVDSLNSQLSTLHENLVSSTLQSQDILDEAQKIKRRSEQLLFQLNQLRTLDESEELPRTYIDQNTVFYSNTDGQRTVLAEAEFYNEVELSGFKYIDAILSPRKDFVAIWYKADQTTEIEIFEVKTRESTKIIYNDSFVSWTEVGIWTNNGLLEFISCHNDICGSFISETRLEPWIVAFTPDKDINEDSTSE